MAQKLETLALNARDAVGCCEAGAIRMNITIANLAAEFLDALINADSEKDDGLALISPGVALGEIGAEIGLGAEASTVPRIVRLTQGTAGRVLGVGVVLLIAGIKLGSIARQTGALEATSTLLDAIVQIRSKTITKDACEACVRSKVFGQDSPRRKFALKAGGSVRKRQ